MSELSLESYQGTSSQIKTKYVDKAASQFAFDPSIFPVVPKYVQGVAGQTLLFDMIPYTIHSNLDPSTIKGRKVGDANLMLNVWMHLKVGPSSSDVLCPKQYGKPCQLCDEADELRKQWIDAGKPKEMDNAVRTAKAKQFCIAWMRCYVNNQPEPFLRLFKERVGFFAEEFDKAIQTKIARGAPFTFFRTDDKGATIAATPSASGFGTLLEWGGFDIGDRIAELPPELIAQAYSLDTALTLLTPEQIDQVRYGMDTADAGHMEPYEDVPSYQAPATQPTSTLPSVTQPQAQVQQPVQHQIQPAMQSQESDPEFNVSIDFGDGPTNADPGAMHNAPQSAQPANECPAGHRYGKQWHRTPECAGCVKYDACSDAE